MDIFKMYATKADFVLSEDASDKMLEIFERLYEEREINLSEMLVFRAIYLKKSSNVKRVELFKFPN